MSHKHLLNTFTPDFKINAVTREVIQVQPDVLITLMQYDHNSESLRFECPRFIDGHDMSLCNKVEVHFVNSDVAASVSKGGYYTVTDIAVNSGDPSLVNFSWVVSRNSTENVGTLVFSVRFICTTGDTIDYVWHTLPFTYVSIDQGLVSELDPEYQKVYLDNLETEAAKKVVEAGNATTTALEAAERASEAINDLYSMDVTNKAPAIVCEASGEVISITDSANMPLKSLRLFGRSIQDGIPTPDAPVEIVSMENPVVNVCGKNLVKEWLNGSNSAQYAVALSCKLDHLEPDTEYTISFIGAVGHKIYVNETLFAYQYVLCDGNRQYLTVKTRDSVSKDNVDQYSSNKWIIFKNSESNTVKANFTEVQIELGNVCTDYEINKPVQTVSTDYTLNGIPVASGGNYTDSNGQQWVCDEVDLERGIHIKRVGQTVFDGNQVYHINDYRLSDTGHYVFGCSLSGLAVSDTPVISNRYNYVKWANWWLPETKQNIVCYTGVAFFFFLVDQTIKTIEAFTEYMVTHPTIVQYILTTPVETPLTETEIAAYKALHTNKPSTIILNDSGAWQSVDYVADTKLYIDNKFAELANK